MLLLAVRLFLSAMHLDSSKAEMSRSNEHLLELALQGDRDCFGELSKRWQQKIYAFICRYVGNAEDARDLTQDTFVKAYRNLDRLTDPARFFILAVQDSSQRVPYAVSQAAQSTVDFLWKTFRSRKVL